MSMLIKDNLKKRGRGRPSTGGAYPLIGSRMPPDLVKEIDSWASANKMSRAEAIRVLVKIGLGRN
ncbi:hypothetical protein AA15669_1408 [Saccharibacter floricola DSM 15669]|uniref:Ribbon-helix-helix protein CopG domain-containing protein n=1 Tax=Saccharibacter floricola DSM 15669 TaxID=1123227 RepID=A0ABQ0P029_9PROT|nr:hypothetical protein AA15669_1408 [Saccharibacter floricola DSM 15669]